MKAARKGLIWTGLCLVPVISMIYEDIYLSALTADQGFALYGEKNGDNSGISVNQAGDVNHDGVGDLIFGARYASPLSRTTAGTAYVVFGRRHTSFGSAIDFLSMVSGPTVGFRVIGAVAGDRCGISVNAAGDFNNDGIDDVIIGAQQADPFTRSNAGTAYVIFGRNSSANVTFNADIDLAAFVTGQHTGFKMFGAGTNYWAGYAVSSAGDFNGDGISDVLVGSHQAAPGGRTNAGIAYLIYGRNNTASGTYIADIDLLSMVSSSTMGFRLLGEAVGDFLGRAVGAAGDVNDDGVDDIVVGAYVSGVVYVLYGSPSHSMDFEMSALKNTTLGFRVTGADPSHWFGFAVSSAGDLNGDGVSDIIAGGYKSDLSIGMAYVLFGRSAALPRLPDVALSTVVTGRYTGFRLFGAVGGDQCGYYVSTAGDVNEDGLNDILVASPQASPSSSLLKAGISYLIFGRAVTSDTTAFQDIYLGEMQTGSSGLRILGAAGGDISGWSVSTAGDLNHDGVDDIVVGAYSAKSDASRAGAGITYVIYGSPATPTSQPSSQPSMQPIQPSSQPSSQPSTQPSIQPTGQPSAQPSFRPSTQPTSQPSSMPTMQPSSRPSAQPSEQPSTRPSGQPSMQPTSKPSTQPSALPTCQPSARPSLLPSAQPVSHPSAEPSALPSRQPSAQPSTQPSLQPSGQPTLQPSSQPSSQPSTQPLSRPSAQPSAQLSAQPSAQPSTQPSLQPSARPSEQPSTQPSSQPSEVPSVQPVARPTTQPSARPSTQPSATPSGQPTLQPSSMPLCQPSNEPTVFSSQLQFACPSGQPSVQPSRRPSTQPSAQPTSQPSAQPSTQPSTRPSHRPSSQPSSQPTSKPTSQPSSQPASQPTSQPSRQPSRQPVAVPSAQPTASPQLANLEATTLLNNTSPFDSVSSVDGVVWGCGRDSARQSSCVVMPATGASSQFILPWDETVDVTTTGSTHTVLATGCTSSGSTSSCAIANCVVGAELSCAMTTFSSLRWYDTANSAQSQKVVHVGTTGQYAVVSIADSSGDNRVSYTYASRSNEFVSLLRVSTPSAAVSVVAGTRTMSASQNNVVVGWINTDSGALSTTYLATTAGTILNSEGLVRAMVTEATGPDSFIGGGLELSDGAGVHAYLVRANALYRKVAFGVRYVPKYTRRQLTSAGTGALHSTVNAIVLVSNVLFMVVEGAYMGNSSVVSVLKTNTVTGAIVKQVTLAVPNSALRCSHIVAVDTLLSITCTTNNSSGGMFASYLLTVDQELSFTKLPPGFVRATTRSLEAESVPFTHTTLPVTKLAVVLQSTMTEYTSGEMVPTTSPTAVPTARPSRAPSTVPSAQPSSSPTSAPSVSHLPTSTPSTSGPTGTAKPTFAVTTRPTLRPTLVPSARPSLAPTTTAVPSASPTVLVTLEPSAVPSAQPSAEATERASIVPSTKPSFRATVVPTVLPTQAASPAPTTDAEEQNSHTIPTFVYFASVGGALVLLVCCFVCYKYSSGAAEKKDQEKWRIMFRAKQIAAAEMNRKELLTMLAAEKAERKQSRKNKKVKNNSVQPVQATVVPVVVVSHITPLPSASPRQSFLARTRSIMSGESFVLSSLHSSERSLYSVAVPFGEGTRGVYTTSLRDYVCTGENKENDVDSGASSSSSGSESSVDSGDSRTSGTICDSDNESTL